MIEHTALVSVLFSFVERTEQIQTHGWKTETECRRTIIVECAPNQSQACLESKIIFRFSFLHDDKNESSEMLVNPSINLFD